MISLFIFVLMAFSQHNDYSKHHHAEGVLTAWLVIVISFSSRWVSCTTMIIFNHQCAEGIHTAQWLILILVFIMTIFSLHNDYLNHHHAEGILTAWWLFESSSCWGRSHSMMINFNFFSLWWGNFHTTMINLVIIVLRAFSQHNDKS